MIVGRGGSGNECSHKCHHGGAKPWRGQKPSMLKIIDVYPILIGFLNKSKPTFGNEIESTSG